MSIEEQKQHAGERAAELIEDGMTVGLGSGSTALAFVDALAGRVAGGLRFTAVSSSERTSAAARAAGIELVKLEGPLDIAVDGADAIERGSLSAIKGLGGALAREKLVALAAERFILIGDATKVVDHLRDSQPRLPLPVEVLPFGWQLTRERLCRFGEPILREEHGVAATTDNGNLILDLDAVDYDQLPDIAAAIKGITGVVEHGLFLNLATIAIVASEAGVEELRAETP